MALIQLTTQQLRELLDALGPAEVVLMSASQDRDTIERIVPLRVPALVCEVIDEEKQVTRTALEAALRPHVVHLVTAIGA